MLLEDTFLIETGIMLFLGLSFYIPLSAGLLNASTAGFMAIGAYTSALLVDRGQSLPIAIGAALLLALVGGALVASLGVRLSGFGLAIVTIGLAEITRVTLNNLSFTGGALGLTGIPLRTTIALVYVPLVVVIIVLLRLESGRVGRSLAAMRVDLPSADALGVPTLWYRWLTIALSGSLAAYAGAMEAFYVGFLEPSYFNFALLVGVATAVVLGGRTTVWGPVAGILFVQIVPEFLRFLIQWRQSAY
ncbi:MAG: branched-chain amino acid transport system permease protein, partial [Gaiellaceae bacterium]|nr:branched-chain amino acid transport system permease protein [Gaiellaceae bacterium]